MEKMDIINLATYTEYDFGGNRINLKFDEDNSLHGMCFENFVLLAKSDFDVIVEMLTIFQKYTRSSQSMTHALDALLESGIKSK